jgi:hypothetical protein
MVKRRVSRRRGPISKVIDLTPAWGVGDGEPGTPGLGVPSSVVECDRPGTGEARQGGSDSNGAIMECVPGASATARSRGQ